MKNWSLRRKIVASVGMIILGVMGVTTFFHIQYVQNEYFQAVEWRSEILVQSLKKEIIDTYKYLPYTPDSMNIWIDRCGQLYEDNQDKNVAYVAVIDTTHTVRSHNDSEWLNQPITSQRVLSALERHEAARVLDTDTYHFLFPVIASYDADEDPMFLGALAVGLPKDVVDQKVDALLKQALLLLLCALIVAYLALSRLMYIIVTVPVKTLVNEVQHVAQGKFVRHHQYEARHDEFALIGTAFNQITDYLRSTAEIASHIAHGQLSDEVQIRSEADSLGKAVHAMLHYLKSIEGVAIKIADGDLTDSIRLRSTGDAFGQAMQAMVGGLRTLIVQIRESTAQIVKTEETISSLSGDDMRIVRKVRASADDTMIIMREMEGQVEEVSLNMDVLSSSVEETSASISEMTSSITHIAANTHDLTAKIHGTLTSLEETVSSLEKVAQDTGVSKELSQETMQDALEGQTAVEQMTASMETIQHTITTAVDSITQFEQGSRDIDTILDVIRDITEQTSLLALNASIIAAQAGEHGRGFAVVADEIRSLASRVGTSTKDIAHIVHTLQQDTERVVSTIHEGVEKVQQGMQRTRHAQEKLAKISSSAQRSSTVVTNIADTLHAVMTASRNVSEAMEQVNNMTDEITTATSQQEKSAKQMDQALEHINTMASHIQKSTTEQSEAVHHVIAAMLNVTELIAQNLDSSGQITITTEELSSQANILLQSVERFRLHP